MAAKRTSEMYEAGEESFSQETIAALGKALTERYLQHEAHWNSTEAATRAVILAAAQDAGVPDWFSDSVSFWVGLFIDHYHDTDPSAGALVRHATYTDEDWLQFGYDMIIEE